MSRRDDKRCLAYFIQETFTGAIKIGSSRFSNGRLGSLQTGNAYQLITLGHMHGGRITEKKLHWKFRKYRLLGEWFSKEITQDVKKMIVKDGKPSPVLFMVDHHEPTIALEYVSRMTMTDADQLKEWMEKRDIGPVRGSKGLMYDSQKMRSFLTQLRFEDGEGLSSSIRDMLLGKTPSPIVQVNLFSDGQY